MSRFYLYDAAVVAVPGFSEPYQKELLLFCIDDDDRTTTLVVTDFVFSVLCLPKQEDLPNSLDDFTDTLNAMLPSKTMVRSCSYVEATPAAGFHNNRTDRLIQIKMKSATSRYKIMETLEEFPQIGEVHVEHVLHKKVDQVLEFLHATGLRYFSWFSLSGGFMKPLEKLCFYSKSSFYLRFGVNTITCLPDVMKIPTINKMFLRIQAKSSTATVANRYSPNADVAADRISHISFKINDEKVQEFQSDNELELLQRLGLVIRENFVHMFVFSSDTEHLPSDFNYLIKRNNHLIKEGYRPNLCLSLFALGDGEIRESVFNDKLIDTVHGGRLRFDVVRIIQRFMTSPPLDSFTLDGALAHPKLIKDKSQFSLIADATRKVVDMFSSDDELFREMKQYIMLMKSLDDDNGFFLSQIAISTACDLGLNFVIERGQQTRSFRVFMRALHENHMYFNAWQLEKPYVVVPKTRAQSSYPDPVWLPNPPISCLRQPFENKKAIEEKEEKKPVKAKKRKWWEAALAPKKPEVTKKRFSGGLVLLPEPGFYSKPDESIYTLDFASLYPSIMEGYRICHMRVAFDKAILDDPLAKLEFIPLNDTHCAVFVLEYDGKPVRTITDKIMNQVQRLRKKIKNLMKTEKDPFAYASLDGRQASCKVVSNSYYGATGSESSELACTAISAAVTNIGQWANKTIRHVFLSKYGGRVVGGDTDSNFVQFRTPPNLVHKDEIMTHLYSVAHDAADYCSKLFPAPNELELEVCKSPMLLTAKKKTYCSIELGPSMGDWNKPGKLVVKGFSAKKRDKCKLAQDVGVGTAKNLVTLLPDEQILQFIYDKVDDMCSRTPTTIAELMPFIITVAYSPPYTSTTNVSINLVKQIMDFSGRETKPGRRLPYVIAYFADPSLKHAEKCVIPPLFIKQQLQLDMAAYVEKQVFNGLKQILSLPVHAHLLQTVRKICDAKIQDFTNRVGNMKTFGT